MRKCTDCTDCFALEKVKGEVVCILNHPMKRETGTVFILKQKMTLTIHSPKGLCPNPQTYEELDEILSNLS